MENLNHPYPKQIFVFGNDKMLGDMISKLLKIEQAEMHVREFKDGEKIPHQNETVRGRDVFIILTSQNGRDADSWLLNYLRFVRSVKCGQPHKITVIIPKLPHQRQDVEDRELRQPKMSNFFPEMLKSAGADHLVVCKLHNPASQTTDPPMENIDTTFLIINYIKDQFKDLSLIAIATGDLGGAKYGRQIAKDLNVPLILTDKDRDRENGDSKAMQVFAQGKISSRINTVVFVDDLISTFGTLKNAANAIKVIYPGIIHYEACVTHPDFSEDASRNIAESLFRSVCVMDTVPVESFHLDIIHESGKKLVVISTAKVIAQAIDNLHNGKPISSLWLNGKQNTASLVATNN